MKIKIWLIILMHRADTRGPFTEKYLQALRALRTAQSLDPSAPALRPLIAQFFTLVTGDEALLTSESEHVRTTIKTALPTLLEVDQNEAQDRDALPSIDRFVVAQLQQQQQQEGAGDEHVLAAAKALAVIQRGPTTASGMNEIESLVFQLVASQPDQARTVSLKVR